MIGAIAGDIIGSRFEGHLRPPRRFALFHPDCTFTDDTVCTVAIADAIMSDRQFAQRLRKYARTHPYRGYGGMFEAWAADDHAGPYGSWANGAPMRTAAAGWLATSARDARRLAAAQSKVTHNHPEAVAAAQAITLAIFWLRQGAATDQVRAQIEADFGYQLDHVPREGAGFDVSAIGSTPLALSAALHAKGWIGAVRAAVGLGGDTDTLACMAGAVAEARFGVPRLVRKITIGYLPDDLKAVVRRFVETRQSNP